MMPSLSYELNNKDPENKKRFIRNLFDSIVPSYDLLNHVLSFGTDILWRRRIFRHIHSVKNTRAIDLCCGTGDLSLLLYKHGAKTVSLDFSLDMLRRGLQKQALRGYAVAADASLMPFSDSSFETATIAFGIRNIPDLDIFIKEVYRVLSAGGEFAILELVRPGNALVRALYSVYLNRLIPFVGGVISGRRTAYKYLSGTIKTFVDPADLKAMLEDHGFSGIAIHRQTFGVAAIIVCKKS